jgi:hypothetical protein
MPDTHHALRIHDPSCRHGEEPVVVCGAGAAGMAAALSAARVGALVYLVEATGRLGGTVVGALIHTLAGLYDAAGDLLQHGLAAELVDRLMRRDSRVRRRRMGRVCVLNTCPNLYRQVVEEWIAEEPGIAVLRHCQVRRVVSEGGRVNRLEIAGRGLDLTLRPQAVVDTTGTAEIVRLIDPRLLHDGTARSAAGLIFRMRGVVPGSLGFPRGVMLVQTLRAASAEGKLPPTCDKAWIDTGLDDDEAFVKLFVPLPPDWHTRERRCEITRQARRVQSEVVRFLAQLPPFAQARVVQSGRLGIRDGGRVRGEYCLSGDDVRQLRKFEDAACRGCWPIEYWDPERGVTLEYLPEGDYYEIPLRSLKVQGLANVWTAGKCLSADPHAHASARVVGTCWAMGEAVGKAALSWCRR